MSSGPFFRTTILLEVLSDVSTLAMDLEEILAESRTGSFSANVKVHTEEEVGPLAVMGLLVAQRSDPLFLHGGEEDYGCGNCGIDFQLSSVRYDSEGNMYCPDCGSSEVGKAE